MIFRRPRGIIPKVHITLSISRDCADTIASLRLRNVNISEKFEEFIMAYDGVSEAEVDTVELESEILNFKAKLMELEVLKKAKEKAKEERKEKQERLKIEGKIKELNWGMKNEA